MRLLFKSREENDAAVQQVGQLEATEGARSFSSRVQDLTLVRARNQQNQHGEGEEGGASGGKAQRIVKRRLVE